MNIGHLLKRILAGCSSGTICRLCLLGFLISATTVFRVEAQSLNQNGNSAGFCTREESVRIEQTEPAPLVMKVLEGSISPNREWDLEKIRERSCILVLEEETKVLVKSLEITENGEFTAGDLPEGMYRLVVRFSTSTTCALSLPIRIEEKPGKSPQPMKLYPPTNDDHDCSAVFGGVSYAIGTFEYDLDDPFKDFGASPAHSFGNWTFAYQVYLHNYNGNLKQRKAAVQAARMYIELNQVFHPGSEIELYMRGAVVELEKLIEAEEKENKKN